MSRLLPTGGSLQPGAPVYCEGLARHQLGAPSPGACAPGGRLPGLGADTGPLPWPTARSGSPASAACPSAARSAFIIADDKAHCPEEFKAPNSTAASWAGKLPVYFGEQRPASRSPLLSGSLFLPVTPLLSFSFHLRPYPPSCCFPFSLSPSLFLSLASRRSSSIENSLTSLS